MKNIIIYGAPAAGKGTACESLTKKYHYKHISTGDLFRSLNDEDEFARKIKETISKGNLVDDETTTELVKKSLEKLNNKPVILDGFPRNFNQAKLLDDFFENFIVINLNIDEENATKRALGRLNCPKCGKIYHKYNKEMKPSIEGICDICGSTLKSRSDDNEESFKIRYTTYIDNCEEVFKFYKDKNILYMVDSNGTPNETFKSIESIITNLD